MTLVQGSDLPVGETRPMGRHKMTYCPAYPAAFGDNPPIYSLGVDSAEKVASLERAYRLFNECRIDQLLAMMIDDVRWPDVGNGVVLDSKPAIRQYWDAQFTVSDPLVVPKGFLEIGEDMIAMVDRRVFDWSGNLMTDPVVVFHRYSFRGVLMSRMSVHRSSEDAEAT
jgi:hypothetical protein